MLDAFVTGGEFAPLALAPLFVVSALSALDAYRLAVLNNYVVRARERHAGPTRSCPECGRPLDDDLDFCHWCSAQVVDTANADANEADGGDSKRFPLE